MVDHLSVQYVYKKRDVYYFSKRVPKDLNQFYKSNRIVISLKTKSFASAMRASKSLYQKLDDYWTSLRIANRDIPAMQFLLNRSGNNSSNAPKISEALEMYLKLKGKDKDKTFFRGAKRNINYVINYIGDYPIDLYESKDASKFRDFLLEKGLLVSSVKRIFSSIRAIVNLTIQEEGLNCVNAFSKTFMPENSSSEKRLPIPNEKIKLIQSLCFKTDDDIRWLIALLSDTGMRLGEAVGLLKSDIKLDAPIPYIELRPHSWRRLKTKGSERKIPLVGASLWACKRIISRGSVNNNFAFPRYTNSLKCNANSASAALNKWIKVQLINSYQIHSFRHSLRDRLREVECPSDVIDRIGGWITYGVGHNYGEGYSLDILSKWMNKI